MTDTTEPETNKPESSPPEREVGLIQIVPLKEGGFFLVILGQDDELRFSSRVPTLARAIEDLDLWSKGVIIV